MGGHPVLRPQRHRHCRAAGRRIHQARFWIELTSVSVYIVVAYMLALEWHSPIHVIWRADWVYFGGILLGSAACLKLVVGAKDTLLHDS